MRIGSLPSNLAYLPVGRTVGGAEVGLRTKRTRSSSSTYKEPLRATAQQPVTKYRLHDVICSGQQDDDR